MFSKVDTFFEKRDLEWKQVFGVSRDGAPSNTRLSLWFSDFDKRKSPNTTGTHCIIHCQMIMDKTMPDMILHVFNDLIKTVNFVKANALNSRLFAELYKKCDSVFEISCCICVYDGFQVFFL